MFILVLPHKESKLHPSYRTIKSQDNFYLKRAKLLFFEQGKLRISNSPDTLYLPTIKIDSLRKL
ncbi:MAG: hypothetical protein D8H98_16895 [Prevotella sp.]|nr:MAG: hypothetical protein D8H98_16895 [Prevotella sp.]